MITGLIFDFDGLLLDTEWPDYQSWHDLFLSFGCQFPQAAWEESIGTGPAIDLYELLAQELDRTIDKETIRVKRRTRFAQLVEEQSLLPGVEAYLADAKRHGLKVGVASSSSRHWVTTHLERLQIIDHFDAIRCSDDVGTYKPDPTVYRETLRALDVLPNQSIAFEDSVHGMTAAQGAGIFCVVVPNQLTKRHGFEQADLRLDSLAEIPLAEVMLHASARTIDDERHV